MIIGISLITIGLLLRICAILSQGANWSDLPVMPKEIIVSGVYKYLRHPAYVGTILIYLGAFLAIPVDYRFCVELVLMTTIYANRAQFENYLLELKQFHGK